MAKCFNEASYSIIVTGRPLEFNVRRVPGGENRLLFINGYGGTFEQPGVKWYMNRFRDHDLDVTYIQLPTRVNDFTNEVLGPCLEVEKEMGKHVAAGFSFGGLTLAYMHGSRRRIFLSPFWAVNDRWSGKGHKAVVNVLSSITKPLLPRQFDKEEAGELAVDDDMEGMPKLVSFRTIEQFFKAQENIPPPEENDVVFYSPKDTIISPRVIENRGIEAHPYQGGHMFYLTRGRKEVTKNILLKIDEGFSQSHSSTS
ncbi:MAG: hypothetical protein U9R75_04935 [Candidatus Thermoplasmatota archaeon]|nr:hypothetical protein [Candidatus Thermoplasmatota archaeon]